MHGSSKGVSARGRRELLNRSTGRRYAKNAVLFRAGAAPTGLYVILEGCVRVVRVNAIGRQHVIHTEGPGGTLGEVPIFDGAGYPAIAIAADATRCLVLSPDGIRAAFFGRARRLRGWYRVSSRVVYGRW